VIRLLVVDDSALMRRLLGKLFAAEGDFEVVFARDGVEALARLHDFWPNVVTLDIQMPNLNGLACLDRVMVERPCPVVMVSSLTTEGSDETVTALTLGAVDFVTKPQGAISLSMDEFGPKLVATVRTAAKARVRGSLRLAERMRSRTGASRDTTLEPHPKPAPAREATGAVRDGVVLVGCSTGGPAALDVLLEKLPASFPCPIVVAQHMPASFTGPLARRLNRLCKVTVTEVSQPMELLAGHVYIGKGDADVIVSTRAGKAVVMAAPALAEHRWHPSVERLVSSAMQHLGPRRLIGVLLTGMGDDGAAAMTRLRAGGGRTIAEAEESAVVWGMPGELVRAGGAELVAPLDDIGRHLMTWTTSST
jgi:two-component system, chemotaxis family, protein-glutamate methylesterase/glutaminase